MKEFITKIINNQQIQLNELNDFIIKYCKMMDVKEPSAQELILIGQMIQMNQFDLLFAVKIAAQKLGIQINILFNKHGQQVHMFIS